jgi:predicted RNA-binding Zn-ribbon protein involved in translation (DUF1610 family)
MTKTSKSTDRKKSWRNLPCPACGKKKFLKDFLNGYPGGEIDETKHIYGGCIPEYWSRNEIACTNCGWEGMKDEVRSLNNSPAKFGKRFMRAINYANDCHAKQVRKSTQIPYICHPLGVASLIIEAGGDEDLAIAGLLHDIPEDCGGELRLIEIKKKFGSRVEQIVRACSDALPEDGQGKAPWKERKEAHLEELHYADDEVLFVTAADKTHNARAIVSDLEIYGTGVWNRFNASQEEILWYYDQIFTLLHMRGVSAKLLVPLLTAIDKMKLEIALFGPYDYGIIRCW